MIQILLATTVGFFLGVTVTAIVVAVRKDENNPMFFD